MKTQDKFTAWIQLRVKEDNKIQINYNIIRITAHEKLHFSTKISKGIRVSKRSQRV